MPGRDLAGLLQTAALEDVEAAKPPSCCCKAGLARDDETRFLEQRVAELRVEPMAFD
jgi:hypothetical protein